MRSASAARGLLLACALSLPPLPAVAAIANQCLPTRCIDGPDEGLACREDADCEDGTCGAPEVPGVRMFVVNRGDDRLCDTDDPRGCSCPETDSESAEALCALSDCSLREALIAANLTPNDPVEGVEGAFQPDLVQVCPGTVVLDPGGEGEDEARSGDLDVLEAVTVVGFPDESAPATVIRGGSDRIFHVQPAAEMEPLIALNLARLTLEEGGDAAGFDASGGAILNEGELFISRAILRDNAVADGDGGAIHTAAGGDTTLDLSTLLGNRSALGNGGAISSEGVLTALSSTFTGNEAGGDGGALYNFSAEELLSVLLQTTVVQNDAGGVGDGIFNAGNEFVLIGVLFDEDRCAAAAESAFRSDGGNVESPGSMGVSTCFPPTCEAGLDEGQTCATDSDCDFDTEGDGLGVCNPLRRCIAGLDADALCSADGDCDLEMEGDAAGTCSDLPDLVAPPGSLVQALDTSDIPFFPLALGELAPESPDRNLALDLGAGPCTGVDQRGAGRPYDAFGDGGNDCDAGSYEARRPRADKSAMVLEDDDGDGKPEPGETLRYTVTLVNDEELFSSGETLLFSFGDLLDPGFSATLIPGTVVPDSGDVVTGNDPGDPGDPDDPDDDIPPDTSVSIENAELPPGGSWTVTYDALIDPELAETASAIENQGAVTFQGVCAGGLDDGLACRQDLECDLDAEDDQLGTCAGRPYPATIPSDDPQTDAVEDSLIVALASIPRIIACKDDLLLVDRLDDGEFNPGDTIRYEVVLTNEGERPAVGAVFEDDPSRDSTLVSGSVEVEVDGVPAPESVTSGNGEGDTSVRVEFDLVDERAGDTVIIRFDVQIDDPIPLGCSNFFNVGMVSGDNFTTVFTDDPDTLESPDETRSEIVFSPLADERTRFKVKLDFDDANRDKAKLKLKKFEIPVPVGPGTEVIVDQGEVRIAGVLDETGRFRSETGARKDRIRLKSKTKNVEDEEGNEREVVLYKLLAKAKKAELAEGYAEFGLVDADVDETLLAVDTRIRIGSDCLEPDPQSCFDFRANLPVFYKAKVGRKGKGKTAVQTLPDLDCPLLRTPTL